MCYPLKVWEFCCFHWKHNLLFLNGTTMQLLIRRYHEVYLPLYFISRRRWLTKDNISSCVNWLCDAAFVPEITYYSLSWHSSFAQSSHSQGRGHLDNSCISALIGILLGIAVLSNTPNSSSIYSTFYFLSSSSQPIHSSMTRWRHCSRWLHGVHLILLPVHTFDWLQSCHTWL